MQFLLQKSNDIDVMVLRGELDKQKYLYEYNFVSIDDIVNNGLSGYDMKNVVPVGSIEFVTKYLKTFHGVNNMNPIEVPTEMRLDKFLNRDYRIVSADEIPKAGRYFIKDVSKLKQFSYCGEMEYFFYDGIFETSDRRFDTKIHLDKEHLYQVSTILDILSEYRVYVFNDEIQGIQFYDGIPTIMPTPDEIKKIKEMINRYILCESRPKAYSLDIAIIRTKNDIERDVAVLEVHPFACLGLYGITGSFLPMAYRMGIDWYLKHNNIVKK